MENYEEKINRRDEIVSVATRLFYEKGYKNTYFESIANEINITAPLISYHFKSKDNLARAVFESIGANIKNKLSEKIYLSKMPYDLKVSTVVDFLTLDKLWNDDENARNFFLEYMNCGFESCFTENNINFFKIHDRQYHLDIDRESGELSMLSIAATFASFSLSYAYYTGRLDCKTHEQFYDYLMRTQFRFMRLHDDEIDKIIRVGKDVFQMLNIQIMPYFQIK
ncbi:MAG: TetR/AcrR family transcriptional regulator [Anaerofustis sp.]